MNKTIMLNKNTISQKKYDLVKDHGKDLIGFVAIKSDKLNKLLEGFIDDESVPYVYPTDNNSNNRISNMAQNITSNLNNVSQGIKSIIKTNVLKKDLSSKEIIDNRTSICNTCPNAKKYTNGELLSCGELTAMFTKVTVDKKGNKITKKPCGCILKQKIKDIKQKCPLDKW